MRRDNAPWDFAILSSQLQAMYDLMVEMQRLVVDLEEWSELPLEPVGYQCRGLRDRVNAVKAKRIKGRHIKKAIPRAALPADRPATGLY